MKRFLIFLFIFISTLYNTACASTIKGGVVKNTVDDRFFGAWIVRGEIVGETPQGFKALTSQIWNLRKVGNVIILENKLSGARGEVKVSEAFSSQNGAFLKFSNTDSQEFGENKKIVLIETPEITLKNDEFEGYDTFVVKKYENHALTSKEVVKYRIIGKRFREF